MAALQSLGTGSVFTRDAFRDHRSSGWRNNLPPIFAGDRNGNGNIIPYVPE